MFLSVTSTARVRSSDLDGRTCGWTTARGGEEGGAGRRGAYLEADLPRSLRLSERTETRDSYVEWKGSLRVTCGFLPSVSLIPRRLRGQRGRPRASRRLPFRTDFQKSCGGPSAFPAQPQPLRGSRRSGLTLSEVPLFKVSSLVIKVSLVFEGRRGRVRCRRIPWADAARAPGAQQGGPARPAPDRRRRPSQLRASVPKLLRGPLPPSALRRCRPKGGPSGGRVRARPVHAPVDASDAASGTAPSSSGPARTVDAREAARDGEGGRRRGSAGCSDDVFPLGRKVWERVRGWGANPERPTGSASFAVLSTIGFHFPDAGRSPELSPPSGPPSLPRSRTRQTAVI